MASWAGYAAKAEPHYKDKMLSMMIDLIDPR
jgi:hypothetical protein